MWKKKAYKKTGMFMLLLILLMGLSATAMAANLSCRTATVTGSYKDPVTGEIEDAGGQDNEALGQSMVENVVDSAALIEENPNGGYYVSLRFHMMDTLSDIQFSVRSSEADGWKEVENKQTASEGEQADFRLPVETEDSVIRASCHVEAMGRDVIFFVTLSDFTEGNQGGFVQTDSEDAAGSQTAASKDTEEVTGLTTGGSGSASLVTGSQGAETVKPQQLNLSAGVWWMLFVIVFCANILAGLALMGARILLKRFLVQKKDSREDEEEAAENELENEPEFTELSESDWEELKDGEED